MIIIIAISLSAYALALFVILRFMGINKDTNGNELDK